MPRATARVDVERLLVSKAPAAELAAAALYATTAAELDAGTADLIIVAVERGAGEELEVAIAKAVEADEIGGQP